MVGSHHPTSEIGHALWWKVLNRYNFGCVTAGDSLFDSRGGFLGSYYPLMTAEIEVLRDVAMATNFGTKIAITGFM